MEDLKMEKTVEYINALDDASNALSECLHTMELFLDAAEQESSLLDSMKEFDNSGVTDVVQQRLSAYLPVLRLVTSRLQTASASAEEALKTDQ